MATFGPDGVRHDTELSCGLCTRIALVLYWHGAQRLCWACFNLEDDRRRLARAERARRAIENRGY